VGERLDVVDERRPSPHAGFEGPRWCFRRLGVSPVEPVHEGGLLTRDVTRGDGGHPYGDRPLANALCQSRFNHPPRLPRGTVDADNHLGGADRRGGEEGAVDHEMGDAAQQQVVLAARGLAFRAVDYDDRGAPSTCDGPQLGAGEKGGPAPTAQAGAFNGGNEVLACAAGQGRRLVELTVAGKGDGPPATVEPGEQAWESARLARVRPVDVYE
jgi:hypothetical protein